MSEVQFDYKQCTFEARLTKPRMFRRQECFYLYVSSDFLIINQEPYAKKPEVKLDLKPSTHVKWLWDGGPRSNPAKRTLKGFVIQGDNYVNQFVSQRVVLQVLKDVFSKYTLQSEFYDEYELGQYLDKGNYAQVYSCTKKAEKKKYAVKIMEKEKIKSIKNGRESVFNQLKILRALDHPNLLKLFEVFQDRNKYYFVMELLEGITLYKEIHSRNKKPETNLTPFEIRSIMKQILSGVQYLAERNIMHRDLKPENIIFEAKNRVQTGLKIVDYGLATYQHEKTVIFTKCGTPGFVAPEVITYDQKSEKIYGIIADMFSVGVIFHILLIKEGAFPGKSRNTILNKNKQAKIDFKSRKYEFLGSDAVDLLSKLLQKDPTKRMTAKEALEHPFLTKDKPIYKFMKVLEDGEEIGQYKPHKVYRNLEDINMEQESAEGTFKWRETDFQKEFEAFNWPRTNTQSESKDGSDSRVVRNFINSICPFDTEKEYKNIDLFAYQV